MARRKATPRHNFDDPEYMNQKAQVLENLEDALQQGELKSLIISLKKMPLSITLMLVVANLANTK